MVKTFLLFYNIRIGTLVMKQVTKHVDPSLSLQP
jgi:hypothetical protein